MSDLVAYVNPRSGSGRALPVFERLRAVEPRLRAAVIVQATNPEDARAALGAALAGDVQRVLAFGGDGTAHLVGNVLLELGVAGRVGLGIVPAGTGSDLARTLGIPRRPDRALSHALDAPLRPIDVLRVDSGHERARYVLNVASAGISGLVDEAVNALPRRTPLSYLGATLGALRRYRDAHCRITVDDTVWHDGGMLLLAVANGRAFGNGMRIAPHARADDGEADVVLVTPVPRWQLPFKLPRIYLGTHLSARFVRWGRARTVRIEPRGAFPPFDLDGESMPAGASVISVVAGGLLVAH